MRVSVGFEEKGWEGKGRMCIEMWPNCGWEKGAAGDGNGSEAGSEVGVGDFGVTYRKAMPLTAGW